jgi:NAD(P)-dependent dehydrogenase (short-subunit alcohol dehydrogenase family)
MPSTNRRSGRSAAITGAGGGLGRDIALGLAAKGYVVFGTAMSTIEVQDLKDASGGRVSLTVCDMTKEESVKAWAAGVSDALGDSGLDVLINNAGILTPGPIEVLQLDAIRREFEVNVFGALSVINAFLPALRKARGRIVQVSTWTASVPLPFNGPSGIQGRDGGICDGLPRRAEAVWNRRRGGSGGQHENRRPRENGCSPQAGGRWNDAPTTRAIWKNLRIVRSRS